MFKKILCAFAVCILPLLAFTATAESYPADIYFEDTLEDSGTGIINFAVSGAVSSNSVMTLNAEENGNSVKIDVRPSEYKGYDWASYLVRRSDREAVDYTPYADSLCVVMDIKLDSEKYLSDYYITIGTHYLYEYAPNTDTLTGVPLMDYYFAEDIGKFKTVSIPVGMFLEKNNDGFYFNAAGIKKRDNLSSFKSIGITLKNPTASECDVVFIDNVKVTYTPAPYGFSSAYENGIRTLSWNKTFDGASYNIYKNGIKIEVTDGLSYSAAADKYDYFQISSSDANGNESVKVSGSNPEKIDTFYVSDYMQTGEKGWCRRLHNIASLSSIYCGDTVNRYSLSQPGRVTKQTDAWKFALDESTLCTLDTPIGIWAPVLIADESTLRSIDITAIKNTAVVVMDLWVSEKADINNMYAVLGDNNGGKYTFAGVKLGDYYSPEDRGAMKTICVPVSKFENLNSIYSDEGVIRKLDFSKIGSAGIACLGYKTDSENYAALSEIHLYNMPDSATVSCNISGKEAVLRWSGGTGDIAVIKKSGREYAYVKNANTFVDRLNVSEQYVYEVEFEDSVSGAVTAPVTAVLESSAPDFNYDTEGWISLPVSDVFDIRGSALDASVFLDAPAGKHGYLKETSGGKFIFEDGSNINFWGINFCGRACFPDYDEAVIIAERVSQLGFNLVRFHSLDSMIFGRQTDGGRMLNPENMDKFCFFMSELKKRGIYYMIDQIVGYSLTPDYENISDAETAGLRHYGFFAEDMIKLQYDFSKQLLLWRNPYTDTMIKDDPALALIDLKNEDALVTSNIRTSEYYDSILQERFNKWLIQKYVTRENLEKAWEQINRTGLTEDEDPLQNTVKIEAYFVRTGLNYSEQRTLDANDFLVEIHIEYVTEYIEFLRSIGIKCLISGATSWGSGVELTSFYANSSADFVDTHQYWNYNETSGFNYSAGQSFALAPQSMTANEKLGIIGSITGRNVYGFPHTVSEWNAGANFAYPGEGALLIASYGAFSGFQPICFAWGEIELAGITSEDSGKFPISRAYNVTQNPVILSSFPSASAIYLGGAVKEAQRGFNIHRYSNGEALSDDNQYMNMSELNCVIGAVGAAGLSFDDRYYDDEINDNGILQITTDMIEGNKPIVSYTDELSADRELGIFRLNTQTAQAVSGFIAGKSYELDDLIVKIDNSFATVTLNSIDKQPIYKSSRMLLTTLGQAQNTGFELESDGKTIRSGGTAPVLAEPVTGRITLKTANDITVYPLSASGSRLSPLDVVTDKNGRKTFELLDSVLNYEIVCACASETENEHITMINSEPHRIFADIDDCEYKNEIERLAVMGYMSGVNNAMFMPERSITRGDIISLAVNIYTDRHALKRNAWYSKTTVYFDDIPVTHELFEASSIACGNGLLPAKWKTVLNPEAPVTRGEAMYIIAKVLEKSLRDKAVPSDFDITSYSDYSAETTKSEEYYKKAMGNGYVSPVNNEIAAGEYMTRAEAAKAFYNVVWR